MTRLRALRGVLVLFLSIFSGVLCVLSSYLLLLTGAAVVARVFGARMGNDLSQRLYPPLGQGRWRFAVLVPAHNEEMLIGRLLDSLAAQDYPRDRFDVHVVADNCDDQTADIAQDRGAQAYERLDPSRRGKGYALQWLLEQVRHKEQKVEKVYDAFVVLDADSVVTPNFLRGLEARLESGSQVVQAYYATLNPHASQIAGLRYAALAALHYVRPLGRLLLGLSCGLKGNGMCFASPVLERFSWESFTLAEDVEFHLTLMESGIRVDFAPEVTVLSDMPVTLGQAESQNERWERGRLYLLRERIPALIRTAMQHRSAIQLDAAAEQLIPPLSVLFSLGGVCAALALLLREKMLATLAGAAVVGQVAHLLSGLVMVRAPASAYRSLLYAPLYIAWKMAMYLRALGNGRAGDDTPWVRTSRQAA